MSNVIDNKDGERFELDIDGQIVFADYNRKGGVLHITHVEAPVALRGSGVAGQLMEGIVGLVRASGDKIYPICPYAVSWLRRHPENADVVA